MNDYRWRMRMYNIRRTAITCCWQIKWSRAQHLDDLEQWLHSGAQQCKTVTQGRNWPLPASVKPLFTAIYNSYPQDMSDHELSTQRVTACYRCGLRRSCLRIGSSKIWLAFRNIKYNGERSSRSYTDSRQCKLAVTIPCRAGWLID